MTSTKTRVAIHGAAGRMGQRLIVLATEAPHFEVVAALESPEHTQLGRDAGRDAGAGELGVLVSSQLEGDADVVIDFSVPAAAMKILHTCTDQKIPLVIATTGFDEDQQSQIHKAAETIPICWAPSMSLAVNLLMKLSETAATALKNHPSGTDVEIIERHHRFKEDAPSGTALAFGKIIADAMGLTHERHGREGRPGVRPRHEIGYHAVRTGDNPGQHTILFGLLGESIELTVTATSRDCYAQGALAAAHWLTGKPPRLYDMQDVLTAG